jgi:hypothetical protein|tara:strand:- start:90 stop:2141 length:2052 start_codon:yes stop_codon:yes gene_type:complete
MQFKDLLKEYDPNWPHATIDFETFYIKNKYSVSDMSYYHYCRDDRFNAFMVSIYIPAQGDITELKYVGPVEKAPWIRLRDCPIWLAHNSPFDRTVYERCQELGLAPEGNPKAWVCTANLSAFMKCQRNLSQASQFLLNRKMDKTVRSNMNNKVYLDIPDEEKEEWKEYAMIDSINANDLWVKYKDQWPRTEQLLSLHTSECVKRGVKVDVKYVKECLEALQYAVDFAAREIPWYGEEKKTKTGKTSMSKGEPVLISPTSSTKLALYAREKDIPLPESTDVKSPEFQKWERDYGEKFPVIKAIQTWRKCNRLLKIFEHIDSRIRDDGRMEFQLCYFGAHTGRWSGRPGGGDDRLDDEKGLNMQNLPRDPLYLDDKYSVCDNGDNSTHKIDTRGVFIAPKLLGIADLSQIEPRVLHNLVGDRPFVEKCREGISPYEVHARTSMGYEESEKLKSYSPMLYALAKARLLALGFQAAWEKFIFMAYMYVGEEHFDSIFGVPTDAEDREAFCKYLKMCKQTDKITLFKSHSDHTKNVWVNSWLHVSDYRKNNPRVTGFWRDRNNAFKTDAKREQDHYIELPSGRTLGYLSPTREGKASNILGGKRNYFYGGKIVENCVQAVARDAHAEGLLRVEMAGIPVVWHVHDEIITEIDTPEELDRVIELISVAPDWLPHLPVAAEGEAVERYKK